jgi:hypothetical protein
MVNKRQAVWQVLSHVPINLRGTLYLDAASTYALTSTLCASPHSVFANDVRIIGFLPETFDGRIMRIFQAAVLAVLQNEIASR